MEIEKIVKIVFIIFGVVIFVTSFFGKKPLKTLFLNILLGVFMLVTVNLTSKFTSVYLPINQYTVSGCAILGIPGVIMFLILRLIFI